MLLFLIVSYIIIVLLSFVIFKDNCRYLHNKKYIYLIGVARVIGLLALFIRFFYYRLWSASFLGDMLLFVVSFYMVNFALSLCFFILRKIFTKQKRFHGSESIVIISIVSLILCGFGVQQAVDFKAKDYLIHTEKQLDIKLAFISDLHLGNSLRKKSMNRMLNMVIENNADVLLITGDLFDESTSLKDMDNFIEAVKQLKMPVYYVQGNHEILSVYEETFYAKMQAANIHCLFDETVLVNDCFYIVGRKDIKAGKRQSLDELTKNLNQDRFILVLDHQPITEMSSSVDLQLSGHTHNGQIVPANLLIKLRYKNLYGYYEDEYPLIVTSGVGTWGFPMRMGTQSEVVFIQIKSS